MFMQDSAEGSPASGHMQRPRDSAPNDAEKSMRAHFEARRFSQVASTALEVYGSEIRRFLMARMRNHSEAEEVFAVFAEDLWGGLPSFAWRCSMRTWSHTLARNAARRYRAKARQHARYFLPSQEALLAGMGEELRSSTPYYLSSEAEESVRALRERLEAHERTLLTLRVDRGLAWRDLTIAMLGDVQINEALLTRESARLRKSFERIVSELRRMAEFEGLLPNERYR